MTKIIKCICEHEYQDTIYGRGKRLHNSLKDDKKKGYRCTVCEKIKK